MRLDLVVVAVDGEQRTGDLAVHRLADVERRHDRARLDRLHQHRPVGLAGPADAVLDLLGRMRLGEDVADEVLGEVGIVDQPVRAIVLVPALELLLLRLEMLRRHVGMRGPDQRRGAGQDGGLHPLGMMGREHAGDQAAIRQADKDGLARVGRIHDGQGVGDGVLERVGLDAVGPVGLAVAAPVVGDAAEAPAEVGQLRLVDPRMDDAPGRDEQHGLRPRAVDFVVESHAVALDEAGLIGQLRTHRLTSRAGALRARGSGRRPAAAPGAPASPASRSPADGGSRRR